MTICEQLAADFPRLARHFAERERIGIERYGQPLDAIGDARDWEAEGREEMLDAMVYLTAATERLAESKRVDSDARHRWLMLRCMVREMAIAIQSMEAP